MGDDALVLGALIVVLVLLVGLPVAFAITWGAMGWLLGQLLTSGAEAAHEGSELVATNR